MNPYDSSEDNDKVIETTHNKPDVNSGSKAATIRVTPPKFLFDYKNYMERA